MLLCSCYASTGPDNAAVQNGLAKISSTDDETTIKIKSITTQLSSMMKDKRRNDKRKYHDEDDIQQQTVAILSRPFVTLAYAQTLDGMLAATTSDQNDAPTSTTSNMLLSCPESIKLTHHLRNIHDGILVGGSTFLVDQPRLNCRLSTSSPSSSYSIEDPMPIVLDTHLNNLQRLLFNDIISIQDNMDIPEDISIDTIKAHNPIICCSSNAAKSFLDLLELFQDQHERKKRNKKSYNIIVTKKIDENGDIENEIYLPIKITIQVVIHNKKEDDIVEELIVTLLPCQIQQSIHKSTSLDLQHVLHQLYNQFNILSLMVEGGSGILSSFLNECINVEKKKDKIVDCVCVTTTPKVIGGKWGLPAFRGLDILSGRTDRTYDTSKKNKKDDKDTDEDESLSDQMINRMITFKDCEFVSLGQDSIFLGRL